jgi:SNF2 family DNA or RNA helicase
MKQLKARLERPFAGAPGLMLRRLRSDRLPDLPEAVTHRAEAEMPLAQADAYRRVVADARGEARKGARLAALQRLRAVCLHPNPDQDATDDDFVAASARLIECFRALHKAHDAREAALVFIEDLGMQARLAGIIQRRFRLTSPPDIISGEVSGPRRQARVDHFQAGHGFGVMLISPKAGGVGLTLTRANHVIHLTRWWNPAVEDQCTGRALRIGQTRPVHIHLPMGRLPGHDRAFDHNLNDLLERKRQLMHEALVPPASDDADESALFEATMGSPD